LGIGFGGGLFAVGTLFSAMRMEGSAFIGLALGAWGAVQSTGAGLAMFLGGALRDGVAQWQAGGNWGADFADPALGYSVVYHVEMLLLFVTLVAIGPLVRRHTRTRALAQALPHTP
jgi:BCD family chlorophyll transporter-like MFS transporter